MARLNLSTLQWELWGWRPFAWRMGKRIESQAVIAADIGPLPARLPASAQQCLREAGLIEDWNVGLNSLACEWVENRHWDFSARIEAGALPKDEAIVLSAPGLDYSGWILVDCVEAARFQGALTPHRFDLGAQLGDGKEHLLSIIFDETPREQGQIGYTSRSRHFKPRYGYSWDWCPRIVPVGPWEPAELLTGLAAACEVLTVQSTLADDLETGTVTVTLWCPDGISAVGMDLSDAGGFLAQHVVYEGAGEITLKIGDTMVEPWWPNGAGAQKRYTLSVFARDEDGAVLWEEIRDIGFKHVEWRACEGAPEGAEPWICVVNGEPVFLQGANWVPPKAVYHDADRDDYARLITLYRDMGVNILRVWGGGILEKHDFYDLCDRAGILVWQELPMSSSGVENCPPYAPEAIKALEGIALSYVQRRGHHVSLLLWSGGNELTWGGPEEKTGIIPVDCRHPCIAALQTVLKRHDPGRRFIATSPTGPRFCADAKEYGQGLHHDTHGPWGLGGFPGATFAERIEAWRVYWSEDDSLFRSEVGMPGAASPECIDRYADPKRLWPPQGLYWMHTAAWWTQWDWCRSDMEAVTDPKAGIAKYIRETQLHQAEAYAIAAKACKERFPKCGGFIIWMGHDCFPCPANNSVIDFLGEPKPAYHALCAVFR